MFGSAIIDTAIGLVFVYLLLSFIVTGVLEIIETVVKLRAAHLAKGIQKLLGRQQAERFFGNVLIEGISPNKWFGEGTRKPSYIPSRMFAVAVLDTIAPAQLDVPRTIATVETAIARLPDGDLKQALTLLLEGAQHQLDAFEAGLEGWFNAQMERVSGWYKRKVQLITVAVGLLLSVSVNADTVAIVKNLSTDAALRASLVAQAQEMAKAPLPERPDGAAKSTAAEFDDRITALQGRIQKIEGLGLPFKIRWWRDRDANVADALPGWLLTAAAISLGAPFWFDVLKKVVSVRASGKAPDEKTTP